VPRASKQEDTSQPAAGKAGQEKAATKVPTVEIPRSIGVRQLADLLRVDSIQVIKQLMRNGIMANINQVIDHDTAAAIAAGFGYKVRLQPLKDQAMTSAAEESK
jgi:hypothetical protein